VNICSLPKYFRLTPFQTTSEQGRSDERYRLVVITMLANIISRVLAMVGVILTVSLTVPYLGAERFGVWMTIASFVGMLSFMDLGVGNALTNKVAQVAAKGSAEDLCGTISGGLGLLLLLGFTMSIVLMGLVCVLPWDVLIKVDNIKLYDEINDAMLIFSALFGLNIFTNGIQRIFAGLQRSFEAHMVSALGSIAVLFSLWLATRIEAGIPILLLVTFGVQSISTLTLIYLLKKRSQFRLSGIQSNICMESGNLFNVGGIFLLLQLGTMIAWGADSLIISSQLGAQQVAVFAIVIRLFQISTQPMNIINNPLWGAYADAHARHEKSYIRKTLKISIITTSIFSTFMMIFLIIFGEQIVHIWTGNVIFIPLGLFIAYGFWSIIETTGNAFGMFLNGCGLLKPQIITVLFFSTVGVIAKISLLRLFGIEGMLIGAVLTYIFITPIVYGWIFRKDLIGTLR
jgi:O-antigen/teichoic acid export membrane protein